MTDQTFFVILGYLAMFFAFSIGGMLLVRRRRKTKWPFKDSDKLLRGPGEGLRRRIEEYDQRFMLEYGVSIVGALIVWVSAQVACKVLGLNQAQSTSVGYVALAMYAIVAAWRVIRLWKQRVNYLLGWFGERLVAEKLRSLQREGYHVFHDVPAEPGKSGFNIDHLVVGATGIAVIEVKTRRKGAARPGFKDHEVEFDGTKLVWPWGVERKGVKQAINEADWIKKWVFKTTGLRVSPKPILTIPGWFVRESPCEAIRVINPDFLRDSIVGAGSRILHESEIDLIARQLDILCRDVAD